MSNDPKHDENGDRLFYMRGVAPGRPNSQVKRDFKASAIPSGGYDCAILVLLFRTRRVKRRAQVRVGQRKGGVHYLKCQTVFPTVDLVEP